MIETEKNLQTRRHWRLLFRPLPPSVTVDDLKIRISVSGFAYFHANTRQSNPRTRLLRDDLPVLMIFNVLSPPPASCRKAFTNGADTANSAHWPYVGYAAAGTGGVRASTTDV
jgi:hypothetical protein